MEKNNRKQYEMIALLHCAEAFLSDLDGPAQDNESRFWREKAGTAAREAIKANGELGEKANAELWKRLLPTLEQPATVQVSSGSH